MSSLPSEAIFYLWCSNVISDKIWNTEGAAAFEWLQGRPLELPSSSHRQAILSCLFEKSHANSLSVRSPADWLIKKWSRGKNNVSNPSREFPVRSVFALNCDRRFSNQTSDLVQDCKCRLACLLAKITGKWCGVNYKAVSRLLLFL